MKIEYSTRFPERKVSMPYKRKGETKWTAVVTQCYRKLSRRFATKQEAVEWEVETRRAISGGSLPKTDTAYSIAEWGNDYLDYAEKFSTKTYKEKRMVMHEFNAALPDLTAAARSITPKHALDYLQQVFKARGGNAANKRRKNLLSAWSWGVKYHGLPQPNPFLIERFPETRSKRYVVPEQDFWKVYSKARKKADQTMLLAYLHLGARRNEVFQLRWDDVDFAGQRIRLWTRKRQDGNLEADWLPMTDELNAALAQLKTESQSQWVFPSDKSKDAEGEPYVDRKRWLLGLCVEAKVKPFGFHSIRHLTASILAQAGVPAITIQAVLRHHNLATTEKYLHQLSEVRPALKVLEGRSVKTASMRKTRETSVKLVKGSRRNKVDF